MRHALMIVAAGLIGVAPASALQVEVARSGGVDYSAYRSFGFKAKEGIPPGHPLGADGHMFKTVTEAAAETLLERGMTLISGDTPELWVTFFGLAEEELSIEGRTTEIGGRVKWVGDPGAHSSRTELHVTLIVEIYDAATGERVWSGWATGDTRSPDKIRKRAARATRKILEQFPRD